MLIFLVDDDHEDHEVFCLAVKEVEPSINCLVAKDGTEALQVLSELVVLPNYIFLDINMPLMNGKEVLKRIKTDSTLKDIPVVMYSTSADGNDIHECLRLGASDYLVKPANFIRLVEGVKSILFPKPHDKHSLN